MTLAGRLLVVEDDAAQREILAGHLRDLGAEVAAAAGPRAALDELTRFLPDVVVTDYRMPEMTGRELLDAVKRINPDIEVVVVTAYGAIADAVACLKAGAADYLLKPLDLDAVEHVIRRALERRHLRRENRELRGRLGAIESLPGIVTAGGGAMAEVLSMVARVAPSDVSVLILGESGTGKELVARAIHAASPRASGPFVAVNCGAIPGELFEAEFFGHRKGAFTGAQSSATGKLRLAHGGTLLLDEVGELPLEAQVKFLRAIEEQEFYPVGSSELVRVDTRIVAATHRDLGEMVVAAEFREDLFFRLNVFQIDVAPLRERPEDVLVLAASFLEHFNQKFRKRVTGLSKGARKVMLDYPWKGNVRELRNVIERSVLTSEDGGEIAEDYLGLLLGRRQAAASPVGLRLPEDGIDLDEVEKSLMEQALERSGGNKSKAARLLNMSSATFYYRVEKYGL